jgi:hypothetical protein
MSSTYIASAIEALAIAEDYEGDPAADMDLKHAIAHALIAIAEELAKLNRNLRDANEIPAALGEVCDRINGVDDRLFVIHSNMRGGG